MEPATRPKRPVAVFTAVLAAGAALALLRPWEGGGSGPGGAAPAAHAEALPDPCAIAAPDDLDRRADRLRNDPEPLRTATAFGETLACLWWATWTRAGAPQELYYEVVLSRYDAGADMAAGAYARTAASLLAPEEPPELGDEAAVESEVDTSVRLLARRGNVIVAVKWWGSELSGVDVREGMTGIAAEALERVVWGQGASQGVDPKDTP